MAATATRPAVAAAAPVRARDGVPGVLEGVALGGVATGADSLGVLLGGTAGADEVSDGVGVGVGEADGVALGVDVVLGGAATPTPSPPPIACASAVASYCLSLTVAVFEALSVVVCVV